MRSADLTFGKDPWVLLSRNEGEGVAEVQLTVGAQEIAEIRCDTANITGGSVRGMSSRNTSRATRRTGVSSGMPQLVTAVQ